MSFHLFHGGEDHGNHGGDDGDGDVSSSPSASSGTSVDTVKIVAIFIIPLACFLGALPTLLSHKLRTYPRLLSALNCAAGGFLLGFGLLHILPDAVEDFANAGSAPENVKNYPVVYALTICSFLGVMLLEKWVMHRMEHMYSRAKSNSGDSPLESPAIEEKSTEPLTVSVAKTQSIELMSSTNDIPSAPAADPSCCIMRDVAGDPTASETKPSCGCGSGCQCGSNCGCGKAGVDGENVRPCGCYDPAAGEPEKMGVGRAKCGCSSDAVCVANAVATLSAPEVVERLQRPGKSQPERPTAGADAAATFSPVASATSDMVVTMQQYKQQKPEDGHDHAHAFHTHAIPEESTKSPYAAYILTMAISFHSIFEGLAIGLGTQYYATLLVFIGIMLHKFSEAFAMGVNLQRANVPRLKFVLLIFVFASIVPIGIGIGWGVQASLDSVAQALASGILNGFAVGVFLYISILGMIVEEFSSGKDLWLRGGLVFVCAMSMGFLALLE